MKALKPKLPEIYYVPPHLAVPFTEEEIAAYIEVTPPSTAHATLTHLPPPAHYPPTTTAVN